MTRRRLIVNADDFGRSHSINEAIIRAHREGILTSASLMINEPATDAAVALARENPQLGVGLHLTFLLGHSALPQKEIPGLVNERGEFRNDPVKTGLQYFFRRELREPLRKEIRAQFERFHATGLPLDHVNGHLHLHMHPVIFDLLMAEAESFGIRRMRLTREPFWMDFRLASGRRWYRGSHAMVYFFLSRRSQSQFRRKNIRHTERVFGLLEDSHVDEPYLMKLLDVLPEGDSELYSHPSLDNFKHEFDALISPRVKERLTELNVERIRYQDL